MSIKHISTLPKDQQLPQMLATFKDEIKRALPAHLSADRMSRIALTAFRQSPLLAKCDPASVFAAVIQSSQLGLEIGINGQAFLVPYKDGSGNYQANFIPGWKGLVDLVNRAGRATVWTAAVYEGDEFDWGLGDKPFIHHKPLGLSDEVIQYYAVGRVNKADWPNIEVWSPARVERHRDKYNKVGKRHYSYENFEMYARKVVLLQVLKYLPSSAEMSMAVALNDAAEMGSQKLNINDAVDGTWAPAQDGDDAAPTIGNGTKFQEIKSLVQTLDEVGLEPNNLMKTVVMDGLTEDEKKVVKFDIGERRRALKKAREAEKPPVESTSAVADIKPTPEPEKKPEPNSAPNATDWMQMLNDAKDDEALGATINSVPDDLMGAVIGTFTDGKFLNRCFSLLTQEKQEQFSLDFDLVESALAAGAK
jgi:recombination protein RecT